MVAIELFIVWIILENPDHNANKVIPQYRIGSAIGHGHI